MTRRSLTFRLAWMLLLVIFCLAGFALLGLLVLSPERVLANLEGEQPVSIQSMLRANYAADDRAILVPPIDIRLVDEAIRDQITPRAGVIQPGGTVIAGRQTATAGSAQRSITPPGGGSKTPIAALTASATKMFSLTLSPGAVLVSRTPTRINSLTPGVGPAISRTPSPTGVVVRPSNTSQPATATQPAPTAVAASSTPRPPSATPLPPSNTPRPSTTSTTGGYPPPPQPTQSYP